MRWRFRVLPALIGWRWIWGCRGSNRRGAEGAEEGGTDYFLVQKSVNIIRMAPIKMVNPITPITRSSTLVFSMIEIVKFVV